MKIKIESESQEEFDSKREEIIKAVAGSKLRVSVSRANESLATEPKEPYFDSQKEVLNHWDAKFKSMISDIKADIDEILR
jgi:hypothetical protein